MASTPINDPRFRSGVLVAGGEWPLALDGRAVHEPAGTIVIVDGVVHGAAIVPDRQVVGAPAQAAGELGPDRVSVEELEQRPALGLGHALEARGVDRVDE